MRATHDYLGNVITDMLPARRYDSDNFSTEILCTIIVVYLLINFERFSKYY